MTNETIIGISKKLGEALPSAAVYTDRDVEQGLSEPAFVVRALSGSADAGILGGRVLRGLYSVVYFPANRGSRAEMGGVAGLLARELAAITLPSGRMARGTDISFEMMPDTLHMTMSYNYGMIAGGAAEPFEVLAPPAVTAKGGDTNG
jgi:hypothetical protein